MERTAKLVPFAGWELPLQYEGILAEHHWTRSSASLFDVSHMGQVEVSGPDAPGRLETVIAADLEGLAPGRTRYAVVTNDDGGIIDDLLVTRRDGDLLLVLNAARVDADITWFRARLPDMEFRYRQERALLALQGPKAAEALAAVLPEATGLASFAYDEFAIGDSPCTVSRSGYTGEDGFEIGCGPEDAVSVASLLLDQPDVRPAGLGARDSLRLEAGLCLYGNDIDAGTSPVEAGLAWTFGNRRQRGLNVPGATRIERELAEGPSRRRVGLQPDGPGLVRSGAAIHNPTGRKVGEVTSGGFSPTLGRGIAMGYVAAEHAKPGTTLSIERRGRQLRADVVPVPFLPRQRRRD